MEDAEKALEGLKAKTVSRRSLLTVGAAASAAAKLRYTNIHERKLCFVLCAISGPYFASIPVLGPAS